MFQFLFSFLFSMFDNIQLIAYSLMIEQFNYRIQSAFLAYFRLLHLFHFHEKIINITNVSFNAKI